MHACTPWGRPRGGGWRLWALRALVALLLGFGGGRAAYPGGGPLLVQGILRTDTGEPVEGPRTVTLRLYADAAGNELVYAETQTLDLPRGVFDTRLPAAPQDLDAFAASAFGAGEPRWLGLEVAGHGALAAVPLLALPAALHAVRAGEVGALAACTGCLGDTRFAPEYVAALGAYDPTDSGLTAATTQAALDELAAGLAVLASVALTGSYAALDAPPPGFGDGDDVGLGGSGVVGALARFGAAGATLEAAAVHVAATNVGIATAEPLAPLHVAGGVRLEGGLALAGQALTGVAAPSDASAGLPASHAEARAATVGSLYTALRATPPAPPHVNSLAAAGAYANGQGLSVTVGSDGLPLIAYASETRDIEVVHCTDARCADATRNVVAADSVFAFHSPSVTVSSAGLPLIAYAGGQYNRPLVASCDDVACAEAYTAQLDFYHYARMPTIAVGSDGLPILAYLEDAYGDLVVGHCNNHWCTSATLTRVDQAGYTGFYPSIAIGGDGLALVASYNTTDDNLRVAHCANVACTSATLTTVDSTGDVGARAVVAVGRDGLGLIAYHDTTNGRLKVAHCDTATCNLFATFTIADVGDLGSLDLTLGTRALGMLAFVDATNGAARVLHCANVDCSRTLGTAPLPGVHRRAALTLGPDALPLVVGDGSFGTALSLAHGPNPETRAFARWP